MSAHVAKSRLTQAASETNNGQIGHFLLFLTLFSSDQGPIISHTDTHTHHNDIYPQHSIHIDQSAAERLTSLHTTHVHARTHAPRSVALEPVSTPRFL